MSLRVGIIGAGFIGREHAARLRTQPGVEVVAAADPDETRAAALGATAYSGWEELLAREELDAVFVCTPPAAHREPAVAALERGLAVYLEKPVARSLDDAAAIAAAARGRICAVGYQWRALAGLPRLRDELADQTIGLVVGSGAGMAVPGRPWFADPAAGGGLVSEIASHVIDFQRAVAGEVVSVQALGARVGLGTSPPAIDDVLWLGLRFASGALGTVHVAWTGPERPSAWDLQVVASRSSVTLRLDPGSDAPERSLEAFLAAARAGDPSLVPCTVEDGAGTLAVVLACERALATGATAPV